MFALFFGWFFFRRSPFYVYERVLKAKVNYFLILLLLQNVPTDRMVAELLHGGI